MDEPIMRTADPIDRVTFHSRPGGSNRPGGKGGRVSATRRPPLPERVEAEACQGGDLGLSDDLAIPWRTPSSWGEALRILECLAADHRGALGTALETAMRIRERLEGLFPALDALCRETCPWCPAPCCLEAAVYADFRDLLFWVLMDISPPPVQLRHGREETCRFSSPRGCTLPRNRRPWICTWYLCATQKAVMRRWGPCERTRFDASIEAVRVERREMEEAFLSAVV